MYTRLHVLVKKLVNALSQQFPSSQIFYLFAGYFYIIINKKRKAYFWARQHTLPYLTQQNIHNIYFLCYNGQFKKQAGMSRSTLKIFVQLGPSPNPKPKSRFGPKRNTIFTFKLPLNSCVHLLMQNKMNTGARQGGSSLTCLRMQEP
jgi:hypothetical protein